MSNNFNNQPQQQKNMNIQYSVMTSSKNQNLTTQYDSLEVVTSKLKNREAELLSNQEELDHRERLIKRKDARILELESQGGNQNTDHLHRTIKELQLSLSNATYVLEHAKNQGGTNQRELSELSQKLSQKEYTIQQQEHIMQSKTNENLQLIAQIAQRNTTLEQKDTLAMHLVMAYGEIKRLTSIMASLKPDLQHQQTLKEQDKIIMQLEQRLAVLNSSTIRKDILISQTEQQNNTLSQFVNQKERTMEECRIRIQELSDDNINKQFLNDDIMNKLLKQQELTNQLKGELLHNQEINKTLVLENEQLRLKINQLHTENQAQLTTIHQKDIEIKRILSDFQAKELKIKDLYAQIQQLQGQIQSQNARIQDQEQHIQNFQPKLNELHTQVSQRELIIGQLRDKISLSEIEIQMRDSTIQQLLKNIEHTERIIHELQDHNKNLSEELSKKIKLNENQELMGSGFELQIEDQRKKYFTIVDKKSQLERQIENLMLSIQPLNIQVEAMSLQISDLKIKIDELMQLNQQKQSTITNLENTKNEQDIALRKLETQNRTLDVEKNYVIGALQKDMQDAAQANKRADLLQIEINKLQQEIKQFNEKVRDLEINLSQRNSQNQALQNQLAVIEQVNNDLKQQISMIQEQISFLTIKRNQALLRVIFLTAEVTRSQFTETQNRTNLMIKSQIQIEQSNLTDIQFKYNELLEENSQLRKKAEFGKKHTWACFRIILLSAENERLRQKLFGAQNQLMFQPYQRKDIEPMFGIAQEITQDRYISQNTTTMNTSIYGQQQQQQPNQQRSSMYSSQGKKLY